MPRIRTLEDGAQSAESVASALVDWLEQARETLDLALYDVRLPGPVGDAVADVLRGAMRRGVHVRLASRGLRPLTAAASRRL